MESLSISNQTLRDFIDRPFGFRNDGKQLRYESRYREFRKNNRIRLVASLEYQENYFLHLKVPSESQKGEVYYDVVVQFFTTDEKIKKELNVENYFVQFFSNSPGFTYKYASLYKLQGYLIESLTDKFAEGALDILPDKANKDYELYYDSSIYYASRYLLDTKGISMGKLSIHILGKKSIEKFFEDIQDIESVSIATDVSKLKHSIEKEIKADTELSMKQQAQLKQKNPFLQKEVLDDSNRKRASKSTFKNKEKQLKKIVAASATSGVKTVFNKKKASTKRGARKSTKRSSKV